MRCAPARALAQLASDDPLYAVAGERLAAGALRARGWHLLAHRLTTRWGEVDLVFRADAVLVVVEVKTGRCGRFRPGERLGREQLARLWRAAAGLARGAPHRVDLVEVGLENGRVRLEHQVGIRAPL